MNGKIKALRERLNKDSSSTLKSLALIAAILLTLAAVNQPLGSLGAAAGGLYIACALLHIWDEWLKWSMACRADEHQVKPSDDSTPSARIESC